MYEPLLGRGSGGILIVDEQAVYFQARAVVTSTVVE